MMEEQDLRRIPETAYLNAENAARYRAILHFCYRRHEHMQTFVYPEEIFRELAQTSFFAAYTEEQLAQDLAQLEAWGNLTAQQEVARAHNIAEFKRKRFRYQCTPYTVEIERMVERLRGLGDSFGGSLETTQFDRLLSHLSSLLLEAGAQSDEQLLQTWEDLLHYFRTLVENASDYLAHLRSAKVEERMQTSAFLAYKDMFTQYLRSFVLGLQRASQQVSALLVQAMEKTAKLTTFVVFILIGARVFSLTFYGVDGHLWVEHLLVNLPGGTIGFLIVVNVLVFLLAFFLDYFELAFIIVPLLGPVAEKMGIDLIWFGVLLGVNMQTSFLHPPFGFALFFLRSVAPASVKTSDIYWGAIPFVCIQLIMVCLIIAFPQMVTIGLDKPVSVNVDTVEIVVPETNYDEEETATEESPSPDTEDEPEETQ